MAFAPGLACGGSDWVRGRGRVMGEGETELELDDGAELALAV